MSLLLLIQTNFPSIKLSGEMLNAIVLTKHAILWVLQETTCKN